MSDAEGSKRPAPDCFDSSDVCWTVPEIRQVLWALGQAVSAEVADQVLAWSAWRRHHQAEAEAFGGDYAVRRRMVSEGSSPDRVALKERGRTQDVSIQRQNLLGL
jgi:hypothetical protein